jgi:hypothetical protein
MITSSIESLGTEGFLFIKVLITKAPKSSTLVVAKEPPKFPKGVLIASII